MHVHVHVHVHVHTIIHITLYILHICIVIFIHYIVIYILYSILTSGTCKWMCADRKNWFDGFFSARRLYNQIYLIINVII